MITLAYIALYASIGWTLLCTAMFIAFVIEEGLLRLDVWLENILLKINVDIVLHAMLLAWLFILLWFVSVIY